MNKNNKLTILGIFVSISAILNSIGILILNDILTRSIKNSLPVPLILLIGFIPFILFFILVFVLPQDDNSSKKTKQLSLFSQQPKMISPDITPFHLSSEFILWDEATIMFWIYVTPVGYGIRSVNHNQSRYILCHYTNIVDNKKHVNWFSLRYSTEQQWQLNISGKDGNPWTLRIGDRLDSGWHHFMVSWSRKEDKISCYVDLGEKNAGAVVEKFPVQFWPTEASNPVIFGIWPNYKKSTFRSDRCCNTKIYQMVVKNEYLKPSDQTIRTHAELLSAPSVI